MTATDAAVVRCTRCDRELVRTPSNTYLECPCPPVDTDAVIAEQAAHEQKVVDEPDPFDVAVTVCAGHEIKMLAGMARDMEAHGDSPEIHWYRGDGDEIRGVVLVGHLATDTVARVVADLRAQGVNVQGGGR